MKFYDCQIDHSEWGEIRAGRNLSVQVADANNAWKAIYNLLKAIKVPLEVVFAWQDNPKAVSPGAAAKTALPSTNASTLNKGAACCPCSPLLATRNLG